MPCHRAFALSSEQQACGIVKSGRGWGGTLNAGRRSADYHAPAITRRDPYSLSSCNSARMRNCSYRERTQPRAMVGAIVKLLKGYRQGAFVLASYRASPIRTFDCESQEASLATCERKDPCAARAHAAQHDTVFVTPADAQLSTIQVAGTTGLSATSRSPDFPFAPLHPPPASRMKLLSDQTPLLSWQTGLRLPSRVAVIGRLGDIS